MKTAHDARVVLDTIGLIKASVDAGMIKDIDDLQEFLTGAEFAAHLHIGRIEGA